MSANVSRMKDDASDRERKRRYYSCPEVVVSVKINADIPRRDKGNSGECSLGC